MRLFAGLPKCFWADAISIATCLKNRGPSVPLDFKIPKDELSGKDVSFAHLKTFDCVDYLQSEKSLVGLFAGTRMAFDGCQQDCSINK